MCEIIHVKIRFICEAVGGLPVLVFLNLLNRGGEYKGSRTQESRWPHLLNRFAFNEINFKNTMTPVMVASLVSMDTPGPSIHVALRYFIQNRIDGFDC